MIKSNKLFALLLMMAIISVAFSIVWFSGVMTVFATPTQVNDNSGSITYSGSWTYSSSSSGYINNDCHYSTTNGDYAQFSFTGTSIEWIGAKNVDHGYAQVYIDGVLDATLDTYNSTWLKQQVIYQKTGLTNGNHTIKIVVTNTKDAGSSNYFQDIDAFQYDTTSATPTPTPAPTSTPTPTPTPSGYAWTRVNDNDSAVSYSGMSTASNSGYYCGDMHYSSTVGAWCQYSFTGTGVRWIGGKNTDHGTADIYIDGVFDSNVSTVASSWLMQQTLYTKTGLSMGPHTIKVQISTSGFQDVDAFEYYAPTPTPLPPKMIGTTALPSQVTYINGKNEYPIGNGTVMAVGDANGAWTQLFGPGYTSPNFISSETIALVIDGVEQTVTMNMHRAAKTGIYYGTGVYGDLRVYLIDNARWGDTWLSRLVMIDNSSPTTSHTVRVKAYVTPQTGSGRTNWLAQDSSSVNCAAEFKADTTVPLVYCGNNVANKYVIVTFNDSTTTASVNGSTYTIDTGAKTIAAGGSYNVSLCHYAHLDGSTDSQFISTIRGMNIITNTQQSITAWQGWYDGVSSTYNLSNITDQRAHDMAEGGLAILKTDEAQDGGEIAHATFYTAGYIRDACLGMRGFASTGHFTELKNWLLWMDHKYSLYGHIPDSSTCEVSLSDPSNKFDMGDTDVEQTSLYLLCARDYYNATGDLATLNSINASLKYCMDIQLKQAVNNSYRIEFNGDETEICGAVNVTASGISQGTGALNFWSLPSVALCTAALDFYIQYLNLRGDNPASYYNSQTSTTMNLNTEKTNLMNSMDTNFWRTDVPEIPNGFHDTFRKKSDNSWPAKRIVNFNLMPIYFGTPYAYSDRKAKDVTAIKQYFNSTTGFLQLVPGADTGFDGHDLGYLLWSLVDVGDASKTDVYNALVNGSTSDCWGSFCEGYSTTGAPNSHDVRTFETGCNISAIAKYWNLH